MSTLAIDSDFNFVDGATLQILERCDEVVQNVRVCLSLIQGESCVFPDAGIDWFSPVMRNEQFASQILQDKIEGVSGVDNLTQFNLITDGDRAANFTASVLIDGDIIELSV